jgi:hypothetical protein
VSSCTGLHYARLKGYEGRKAELYPNYKPKWHIVPATEGRLTLCGYEFCVLEEPYRRQEIKTEKLICKRCANEREKTRGEGANA